MDWIPNEFIEREIDYPELIKAMDLSFQENKIISPPKQINEYRSNSSSLENRLLFMPAWDNEKYIGCKLITTTPDNHSRDLPYINGIYHLFDARSGKPLIAMDAKVITNLRTAATSALAASKLIRDNARSLLILGNGALAQFYIEAHQAVHHYKNIYLWGRNFIKSQMVVEGLQKSHDWDITPLPNYRDLVKEVDVISCITSAQEPLLFQKDLGVGQHLDLAGSFSHDMREVSTDVVENCSVFTDNLDTTPYHAGELVHAVSAGSFKLEDIRGDLVYLCRSSRSVRSSDTENTLFKSTGMATEDLVIATLIYDKFKDK